MESVKSLQFPNKMKFPDYVLDLSMPGGGKEGVIKQKLKDVLAAKLSGTESALSDFFFVGNTGESFDAEPSWIEHGTGSDGWNYYHLMGLYTSLIVRVVHLKNAVKFLIKVDDHISSRF